MFDSNDAVNIERKNRKKHINIIYSVFSHRVFADTISLKHLRFGYKVSRALVNFSSRTIYLTFYFKQR